MAALLLLFLVLGIASELDRFQYKRGNQYDHRDNLEVRHDLTPFAFVRGYINNRASEVKSQAPSVSFLPGSLAAP